MKNRRSKVFKHTLLMEKMTVFEPDKATILKSKQIDFVRKDAKYIEDISISTHLITLMIVEHATAFGRTRYNPILKIYMLELVTTGFVF